MARTSHWEKDKKREEIVSGYLDQWLYGQDMFQDVRRTPDKQDQLKGSDIVLSIPSLGLRHIIIDEKAQLYYTDGGLNTFAFELNFLNRSGKRAEGWLTDPSKETTHYQLLYLNAEKDFDHIDQIHQVAYVLVGRKAVLDLIGLDIETLRKRGREVAQSNEFYHSKNPAAPYYYTHSTRLAESPVNIIIPKKELLRIACSSGLVKKRTDHETAL